MAFTTLRKCLGTKDILQSRFNTEKMMFLIPLGLIFAGWELISRLSLISSSNLPPPSAIIAVLATNITNPAFVFQAVYSLSNLVIGICLAAIVAIPMAIFTGLKKKFDSSVTPLIMIVGALPDLAVLPILVYWFGSGVTSLILMAMIVAFFPIFFTVRSGVKDIPADYFNVTRVYKAGRLDIYTKLVLPAAFPQMVTGFRLAYEFLWEIVLAIEIMASVMGIGFFINASVESGSLTYAFAGIFMIGIIAVIIDRTLFEYLENRIRRWHE